MNFSSKKSKVGLLFVLVLIIILAVAGFFIARQYTKANVDYICTETTALDGQCVVPPEGWGPWTVVLQPTTTTEGQTERIGNGTKEVSLVKTYHSRRTSCGGGTSATYYGNTGGATGWYGATTNVVGASCQIKQFGSIPKKGDFVGSCPTGKVMSETGECINPPLLDLCYNITGIQNPVPADMISDEFYECSDKLTVVDQCNNIAGVQSEIPTGKYQTPEGSCLAWDPNVSAKIAVAFQCSINKTQWTDCSKIVLPSRNQPVWLKANENLIGDKQTWTVEDNDAAPLGSGKSIGLFSNGKNTITAKDPYIKLTFGAGSSFTKEVELAYSGPTKSGITGVGSIRKVLNIKIASQDVIIEI
jgi:hypothetical protein